MSAPPVINLFDDDNAPGFFDSFSSQAPQDPATTSAGNTTAHQEHIQVQDGTPSFANTSGADSLFNAPSPLARAASVPPPPAVSAVPDVLFSSDQGGSSFLDSIGAQTTLQTSASVPSMPYQSPSYHVGPSSAPVTPVSTPSTSVAQSPLPQSPITTTSPAPIALPSLAPITTQPSPRGAKVQVSSDSIPFGDSHDEFSNMFPVQPAYHDTAHVTHAPPPTTTGPGHYTGFSTPTHNDPSTLFFENLNIQAPSPSALHHAPPGAALTSSSQQAAAPYRSLANYQATHSPQTEPVGHHTQHSSSLSSSSSTIGSPASAHLSSSIGTPGLVSPLVMTPGVSSPQVATPVIASSAQGPAPAAPGTDAPIPFFADSSSSDPFFSAVGNAPPQADSPFGSSAADSFFSNLSTQQHQQQQHQHQPQYQQHHQPIYGQAHPPHQQQLHQQPHAPMHNLQHGYGAVPPTQYQQPHHPGHHDPYAPPPVHAHNTGYATPPQAYAPPSKPSAIPSHVNMHQRSHSYQGLSSMGTSPPFATGMPSNYGSLPLPEGNFPMAQPQQHQPNDLGYPATTSPFHPQQPVAQPPTQPSYAQHQMAAHNMPRNHSVPEMSSIPAPVPFPNMAAAAAPYSQHEPQHPHSNHGHTHHHANAMQPYPTQHQHHPHTAQHPSHQPFQHQQSTFTKYTRAHAIASVGFGGRVALLMPARAAAPAAAGMPNVMVPRSHGMVKVMSVKALVPRDPSLAQLEAFPGPLQANTSKDTVLRFLEARIKDETGQDKDARKLLWDLLKVLIQNYGNISSSSETTSRPEKAIQQILLEASSAPQAPGFLPTPQPAGGDALARLQTLLLTATRVEALQHAMSTNMWAHALVLSQQLGPEAYGNTLAAFVGHHTSEGSPMRTLYLLGAKRSQDLFKGMGAGQSPLLDNWRENVAAILSSPMLSPDDRRLIGEIGDWLWTFGRPAEAAHACYMIADMPFMGLDNPHARIVLLGGDHKRKMRSFANITSLQRSEIFEYSKTLGNPQYSMPALNVFKFIYATKLIDYGMIDLGAKYLQALAAIVKTKSAFQYSPTFIKEVELWEERVRVHTGGKSTTGSTSWLPRALTKGFMNMIMGGNEAQPAPTNVSPRGTGAAAGQGPGMPPNMPPTSNMPPAPVPNYVQPQIPQQGAGPFQPIPPSSISQSTSSLPPISGSPSSMPRAHSFSTAKSTSALNEMDGQSPFANQPAAPRPDAGASSPASTAPAETASPTDDGKAKKGGMLKGWLPWGRARGKQAILGEENKFEYNADLKMWVEKGKPLPTMPAPPPPPPTFDEHSMHTSSSSGALHTGPPTGIPSHLMGGRSASVGSFDYDPGTPTNRFSNSPGAGQGGRRKPRYVDPLNNSIHGNDQGQAAAPAAAPAPFKVFTPQPLTPEQQSEVARTYQQYPPQSEPGAPDYSQHHPPPQQ
eukprot:TRINITY_DN3184_c0_g1_i2.p1 TRINITY_DN3184_c0_g1~~TRINITY_DN3184_c0_g1_i2.p1  ORF type:complete len:1431 (+),score=414.97 TRINITY_DN3184_c0_g1_i2:4564-8856(+)